MLGIMLGRSRENWHKLWVYMRENVGFTRPLVENSMMAYLLDPKLRNVYACSTDIG